MTHFYTTLPSPVGMLKLVASEKGLTAILWENDDLKRVGFGTLVESLDHPILTRAKQQLREYFAGERKIFDIKLDFAGTEFQKSVWKALLEVRFGETRSYAQIASSIGNPKAVRAVGAANGRNPISIVAPCHRIIGNDGSLTGFAGGLGTKRYLLSHESGAHAA
jgi:methylated-DNA-[protein]-cysteine S-methyltransferase